MAEQAQQMEAHGYDLETFKGMDGDDLTGLCDELQFPGGIKVRLKRALTQSAAGSATAAQGAPGAAPPTAAVVTSAPVTSAVVVPAAAALPATVVSSPATPGPALSLQPVSAPLSPSPCPPGTCGYCRARPVFQGSPYCGKRCMGAATSAGWVNGSPPGQPAAGAVAPMVSMASSTSSASSTPLACLTGHRQCQDPEHLSALDNTPLNLRSRSHSHQWTVAARQLCRRSARR